MTTDQAIAFGIVGAVMAAFLWGRLRYDVVAALALLAGLATGVVAPEDAFAGFGDDIVIIVASALVVSAAVSRSGVVEYALQRAAPELADTRAQLATLVVAVTAMSALVKNIGALSILLPVAFQMARRSGASPSMFLMPMAFGSLLGGLTTQIGTSPNVIVAQLRRDLTGEPFTMFDFTPVGAIVAGAGVVYLVLCHRLLPARSPAAGGVDRAIDIRDYATEARVTAKSPCLGRSVAELQKLGGGEARVVGVVGAGGARRNPLPDMALREGDTVLLNGEPDALDRLVERGGLTLETRRARAELSSDAVGAVEAIVGRHSGFIGQSARRIALFHRTGLTLLAVSRRNERFTERLGEIDLQAGDVILLQGDVDRLPDLLREWDCLPLAERRLKLGSVRRVAAPFVVLAAALAATAAGVVPVHVAFFAAAVAMVALRAVPLRDVYAHLDAPILLMLAALIPVSEALRQTGGADLLAGWLAEAARPLPPMGALALIMAAAMAVTPFLNNAATVLVMAPVAVTFARDLGHAPEAFLMAVALGAGCDFLTPIGHQCNTLVMGPGGYRFADYARFGAPLTLLVLALGVPALAWVWPLG
jgi:di/tricarboxylate transporter